MSTRKDGPLPSAPVTLPPDPNASLPQHKIMTTSGLVVVTSRTGRDNQYAGTKGYFSGYNSNGTAKVTVLGSNTVISVNAESLEAVKTTA